MVRLRHRAGLTLMELLVAVSIIGMLTALLLPAVQASRESARRTQCVNHLHQQSLAAIQFATASGYYPTGGWGGAWVGDPDRAAGRIQPGGWIYCLLPYVERRDLRQMGAGQSFGAKEKSLARLLPYAISIFNCPTRRAAVPYAVTYVPAITPRMTAPVGLAARSDYAANAGGQKRCEINDYSGPKSLAQGDDPKFAWPDVSDHNGVCYLRSEIAPASVFDGLSHTYLIAEKYLSAGNYETGMDRSDDWSMYTGYQNDICRCAYDTPRMDASSRETCRFGSAHPDGWNAAFCDGSVHRLSYAIDGAIHRRLGDRHDAQPIDDALIWQ